MSARKKTPDLDFLLGDKRKAGKALADHIMEAETPQKPHKQPTETPRKADKETTKKGQTAHKDTPLEKYHIRLSPDDWSWLQEHFAERGIPAGTGIRQLIRDYIRRNK